MFVQVSSLSIALFSAIACIPIEAAVLPKRQQETQFVDTDAFAPSSTIPDSVPSTATVYVPSSLSPSSTSISGVPPSGPSGNSSPADGSDTPLPVLAPGQNPSNPASWTVYNADQVHYPFTVHVPDRVTRNLPPLDGPPPLVLSLSGSGGRGTAADAKRLSGYDGTSRMVRQYYEGNRTISHTTAAEEMLVVTPICPDEIDQANAAWDIYVFPNILAQVVAAYEVDLTRVYLTTYSMGARAAWPLLMKYPDIFAGAIISSGATFAQANQLEALLGNTIRNYYGADDENGLGNATLATQDAYESALQLGLRNSPSRAGIFNSRQLETIGPIPNANHLNMNEVPWQEQVETDGYAGALSWLMAQTKPEGAVIPTYNSSVCTTCIPTSGGPRVH